MEFLTRILCTMRFVLFIMISHVFLTQYPELCVCLFTLSTCILGVLFDVTHYNAPGVTEETKILTIQHLKTY